MKNKKFISILKYNDHKLYVKLHSQHYQEE